MNRKALVFILSVALLLCLFPAAAIAAPKIPGEPDIPSVAEEDFRAEEPAVDDALSLQAETTPADEALPEQTEVPEEAEDFCVSEGPDAIVEDAPEVPDQTPEERAEAASFAEQIEADGPYFIPESGGVILGTDDSPSNADNSETATVTEGESFYAYEGMTVFNNGGTVFNNRAVVYNNAGTVFNNGGKVYNNAGIVYANSGIVFNNNGTVYNNEAEVYSADTPDAVGLNQVFGYYELKLGGYYEPYVTMSGVMTEPGSEKMIISEDSVCRFTPKPGYQIIGARTNAGGIIWDEDGSVILAEVDADTTLELEIQPVTNPPGA